MEQIQLTFAQAEIPKFIPQYHNENRYINFGEGNRYPDYLIDLYNGAAKHAAIINGKCTYIAGSGFVSNDPATNKFLDQANEKQSWHDLVKELCKDVELFGGFYLQCIKKNNGKGFNFYKMSYDRIRTNEDNTRFWYRKDWRIRTGEQIFESFSPNTDKRSTVFFYKETYAKKQPYAFPSYLPALNSALSEKLVSEAILSNAKIGFTATKMITFVGQEPTPEKKREIVNRLENQYTGENGKRLAVQWVPELNFKTVIDDLGQSDLTKEDYAGIDNLITSNLFAGHGITHPLLFGIQMEGKLGGASELREAFYIFKNTYSNAKQKNLEEVVKYFAELNGVVKPDIKLKDVDPIDIEINPIDFKEYIPKEYIINKLGIDEKFFNIPQSAGAKQVTDAINSLSPLVANKVLESMSEDEIRSLVNLQPKSSVLDANGLPIVTPVTSQSIAQGNDALVNITGRQQQALLRISRLFNNGKLTKGQAGIQLKAFGFTDEQINQYLGIDDDPNTLDAAFADESEEAMLAMFESADFGEDPNNYTIVSQQNFTGQDEFHFAFKSINDLTAIESKVATLIKESPEIINEQIAELLKLPLEQVNNITKQLAVDGIIAEATGAGGSIIRKVTGDIGKVKLPEIKVMYAYEKRPEASGATLLPTSRPFCQKMVALSATKLFSREDIQKISERLGYSVFKRAGGFWNNNGKIEYQCRHGWMQKVVMKRS